MSEFNDFNNNVVAEFRANGGVVGGPFAGAPMVLITHTGAKTGQRRTTPLVCTSDGDDVIIIASMGGAPTHPAWYHNMIANPVVTVERGTESFNADVVETSGAERDRLFAAQAALMHQFDDYQAKTTRTIPVLRLVRR
jgi:deazaflavin-dependent oxidoreductase (nitroreductase family)